MPKLTPPPDEPPESSPPHAASRLALPTARPLSARPRSTERREAAMVVSAERGMALDRDSDTTASWERLVQPGTKPNREAQHVTGATGSSTPPRRHSHQIKHFRTQILVETLPLTCERGHSWRHADIPARVRVRWRLQPRAVAGRGPPRGP